MNKFSVFLLTEALFADKIKKSDEKLHRFAENRRKCVQLLVSQLNFDIFPAVFQLV